MELSALPNALSLKEVADQFVQELPNKEAMIDEIYEDWIKEGKRSGKRKSSISSKEDRTRDFRTTHGNKMVHKITFKDAEEVVFKKLQNGQDLSDRTIVNRWSCIRSLMNRAIQKVYVKKDGNPCEIHNGFPETPTQSKTFLSVEETRELIKNATKYKAGIILAYFSLACFSGLRPYEIHGGAFRSPVGADPLRWEDINLHSQHAKILVSEKQSKTRFTRWSPLWDYNANLQILLNHARNLGHDLITTKNFKKNWHAVTRGSKLSFEGADQDKCRRSFVTYLYNKEHDVADNTC